MKEVCIIYLARPEVYIFLFKTLIEVETYAFLSNYLNAFWLHKVTAGNLRDVL